MPYIPNPLNLAYDAEIPNGHYSSYYNSYKPDMLTYERIKFDFEVTGHTSKGSNKIRVISHPQDSKGTCTRLRKNGSFTVPIFDKLSNSNKLVQVTNIYPFHYTKEQQMADEENLGVEGETIKFPWWF